MDNDKRVYGDYLLLPPVGKIVIKKTWQQKFCVLYKASAFGKERLEVYDNPEDSHTNKNPKILSLENCIKITPKGAQHFTLFTKTATYEFGAASPQKTSSWISAFQSVIFRDDISRATSIFEDNDLYCPSGEGIYQVKLFPSEASIRCGLDNVTYTLLLTSTAIQLRSVRDNALLCTWPYCFIRRYGHKDGKFTFEAGRKCETGEGTFFLEYSNQQEIFRSPTGDFDLFIDVLEQVLGMASLRGCMIVSGDFNVRFDNTVEALYLRGKYMFHKYATNTETVNTEWCLSSKMQSMKKLLKGDNHQNPPLLEYGDNQLQAALNMEARTRSPLPPSPTTSTTLHDIESQFSSMSEHRNLPNPFKDITPPSSMKHKPLPYELDLQSHQINRLKPAKPPRKNLHFKSTDKDMRGNPESEYETVSKYDEVECRNNAWKTLGTDEIKHTENLSEEEYISWGSRKEQIIEHNLPKASKIITQPVIPEGEDSYDKLDFFGSSSKLNVPKSGYKQVLPVPVNALPSPPSYNEYDEVGMTLEGVRLADDSHLGYALIRKNAKEPSVDHKLYNNEPYAIISKPKRV